ncbi:MAG: ferrochelatase, partial [Gammaproteobacteria bacterium]|nr:ferrochelatase [Gammaproteobacteria bacterium]
MSFLGEQNFEHESSEKIGVLLCNLGTPDSFQTSDVRKFLKEFLSDGRVVEIPKFIWWFILNGIILIFRPKKSAKLYESVWTKEGSPLMVYSEKLVNKLSKELPNNYEIKLAMRYRNPSIEESLISLK